MKQIWTILLFLMTTCAFASDYYVDSRTGLDSNSGRTPETAWKTIKRVNRDKGIKAGDRVLFARGGLWREILRPHSGEQGKPVYYGAYGKGLLPKLYGSVDGSDPKYWTEFQPGIWRTKKIEAVPEKSVMKPDSKNNNWWMHSESGASAKLIRSGFGFKVECAKPGTASNHIQIWGPAFPKNIDELGIIMKFRARCSKAFSLDSISVRLNDFPYTPFFSNANSVAVNESWQEFSVTMPRRSNDIPEDNMRLLLHLYLGKMPADSVFEFEFLGISAYSFDVANYLHCDAGNLIFEHGEYKKGHRCGIKKWGLDKLKKPGDYWYDPQDKIVYLRWDGNPGSTCGSIEIALRATIIDQGGCHDVVYEDLAVAYGAAHGFGGGNTKRIVIRNCDIYYIGGGHQFTHPNGYPVRFGNGIEFWGSCDQCLVESNRLWEIYDAALTNQGRRSGPDDRSVETNVTYRNNIIWNSEYSFEYWNNDYTENILFENNICWNAGFGWAHGQRPDPNGGHLMFYNNSAKTKNFVIRNNVFSESTEVCMRMENDWREGMTLDGNKYYQSEKPLIRWCIKTYFQKDELKKIQDELGFEKNGKIEKFNPPIFKAR